MSNYSILQGRDAKEEDLAGIVRLDRLVYPEKYQTILENIIEWHKKNKDIVTFLHDNDEIIGYLCILPLEDREYNQIRSGTVVQDVTIPLDRVLEYYPGKSYNTYIFSVVLNPRYHGKDALPMLLKGFVDNLLTLMQGGVVFDRILADAVSEKGSKLLNSLGFKKVCDSNHDSVIHETTVSDMLEKFGHRS